MKVYFSLVQSLQPIGSWAAVLQVVTQESKLLWLCAQPSEHAATTLTKRKEKAGSLYQRDFVATAASHFLLQAIV